ncbi:MAG: hypothetical protein ABJF11_02980 [Reichenbachiella sp.]|uniref:LVIVD repeat-containing protein n=1 Tax=Reichenbachiella sp. TaxID=2184521 RepID=UPI00326421AC
MKTKNTEFKSQINAVGKLIASTLLFLIMLSILIQGCKEACDTEIYTYYEPVYAPKSEVVKDASLEEPRPIDSPGKIYYKDDYLFINEVDQGIHVIDNRDRSNPVSVGFIDLPGNKDLAAAGDFLYADNYTDLVVLDISNKSNIMEVNRIEDVFDAYYYYSAEMGLIVDYVEVQEEIEVDCGPQNYRHYYNDGFDFAALESGGGSTGIGGSLARFTITGGHLYTVNDYQMKLFDIAIADSPVEGNTVDLGWGIETIFPYGNKLFFGARSGMHIYDNSNPAEPTYISTFEHVNTCDPVVVQGDLAYVTLRSGTECETFTNQLDVIDISDATNPELLITHDMQNPHGLGIYGDCLFIAEGQYGLKVFNAKDPNLIGERLMAHHQNVHALDVIPLEDVLFMIGEDGLHQYTYDCENRFDYLSTVIF